MRDDQVHLLPEAVSFTELYQRDFRRVVGLVFAMSGSRSAAEELAQDAFVEAHRRWGHVSTLDDPGAWVRVVALNRARSQWRRRGAEARAMARLGTQRVLPAELSPASADFWRAVRSLPRVQSLVVAMFYADDRAVADIASALGIAEGSVKTHLSRARDTLAERLGAEHSEGNDDGAR